MKLNTELNNTTNSENEELKTSSPEPSHIMSGDYVVLMETNGKEFESWYYFIRRERNEEALKHLQSQLEMVKNWYILDELSTFDIDMEHFVSAKTAKEMTKLEMNSYSFHRKFDGKLQKINFNFTKKDLRNNERMMCKIFDHLGYGQIEDYISDEDLDSEDLTDYNSSSEEETEETEDTDNDSISEDDSEEQKTSIKNIGNKGLPPSLVRNN